jgi:hypothetical protein
MTRLSCSTQIKPPVLRHTLAISIATISITMNRLASLIPVLASLILISGCATPPAPLPPELQYQSPASNSDHGLILGSQENISYADDFTAFVAGVDGKIVVAGRKGWNDPLALNPGNRRLLVQFNRGVFVSNAVVNLSVAAGESFRLMYSTDVAMYGNNSYCDFWVVETKSGKAVSDVVRGGVRGGGRGGTYVPIFIPKR